MHKWERCHDEAANHPFPIALAFWCLNSFHGGMFRLNARFDADLLLYSFSHFERHGHTVRRLTQQHLAPPLAIPVNLSLFTHPSPLSLASKLHQCCANNSHYINNGWTFSGHSSCVHVCVCVCTVIPQKWFFRTHQTLQSLHFDNNESQHALFALVSLHLLELLWVTTLPPKRKCFITCHWKNSFSTHQFCHSSWVPEQINHDYQGTTVYVYILNILFIYF